MKFAHLSDIHLGFQKFQALQKVERQVFENALDGCMNRKVDFILIPGDLFHSNIPEMRVSKFAFEKFRQVHEAGIPVYVVYGSHDFSPVSNSIIDLLEASGFVTKVTRVKESTDEKIVLDFLQDEKTGVKLVGLSGLKVGKDLVWYEKLDRESLESEPGLKIFLFHGGLDELKSSVGPETDFMPMSLLPKGFDYYAGGHMHKFTHEKHSDYPHVVYPGTLFSGYHSDLEDNAKGQKRGFVLVEFEDKITNVEFVPIDNVEYELIEIDANAKSTKSVNTELLNSVKEIAANNKVVIIKVWGELSSGKTTEIDFSLIREVLTNNEALEVKISYNRLTSKEYTITKATGATKEEIETNVFKENIGEVTIKQKELVGDDGVNLARKLLKELGQPVLVNETKSDYNLRISQGGLNILGLDTDDS